MDIDALDLRLPEPLKTTWELEDDTALADRVAVVCAATGALAAVTDGLAFGGGSLLGVVLGPLLGAAVGRGWKQRVALALLGAMSCGPLLLWGFDLRIAQAVMGAALGMTLVLADRWRRSRSGVERAQRIAEAGTVVLSSLAIILLFSQVRGTPGGPAESILRAMAAAGAGLLTALALFPLHLRALRDRVATALRRLRPLHDGALQKQLREIVRARGRVLRLLTQSSVDGAIRDETRRGIDAVALTAIELAERFDPVHDVLGRFGPTWLEERTAQLKEQHARARDAGLRTELERCIAALFEKQAHVRALVDGRERLLARLEAEVASVERAELSLAVHALGTASVSGLRLESVGDELARQAEELHDEGVELQTALTELSSRDNN